MSGFFTLAFTAYSFFGYFKPIDEIIYFLVNGVYLLFIGKGSGNGVFKPVERRYGRSAIGFFLQSRGRIFGAVFDFLDGGKYILLSLGGERSKQYIRFVKHILY